MELKQAKIFNIWRNRERAREEKLILNQFRRFIAMLPALQMVETVGVFKAPYIFL
jgi:hypothetical protein